MWDRARARAHRRERLLHLAAAEVHLGKRVEDLGVLGLDLGGECGRGQRLVEVDAGEGGGPGEPVQEVRIARAPPEHARERLADEILFAPGARRVALRRVLLGVAQMGAHEITGLVDLVDADELGDRIGMILDTEIHVAGPVLGVALARADDEDGRRLLPRLSPPASWAAASAARRRRGSSPAVVSYARAIASTTAAPARMFPWQE